MSTVSIPTDIYESPREIVVLMPLGGVEKKSIELYCEDYKLIMKGVRVKPVLKDDFVLQQDECYRGEFIQEIQLPPYVYFDRIHSIVSGDNILIITIPKSLQPGGKLKVDVELAGVRKSTVSKNIPSKSSKLTNHGRATKK